MSQFQPGDMVEHVGAGALPPGDGVTVPGLRNGIWRITAAGPGWALCRELPHPGEVDPRYVGCGGWRDASFRLVYRPKADLIERLTAEPVFAPPVKAPADDPVAAAQAAFEAAVERPAVTTPDFVALVERAIADQMALSIWRATHEPKD